MSQPKVKTGGLRAQAEFVPNSFNKEARTVDVVFATDSAVLMGYWERYYEILSFAEGHVRMGRLNAGAPMLDSHRKYGAADAAGKVDKAWTDGKRGYATLRFARGARGQAIMDNVEDGIITRCSVGYEVFNYEEVESAGTQSLGAATENKIPTYRAIDWEPFEVSFVEVPADYNAGVRSADDNEGIRSYEVPITNTQISTEDQMFKKHLRFQRDSGAEGEGQRGGGGKPAGNSTTTGTSTDGEEPASGNGTRSSAGSVNPAPGNTADAVSAERERSASIMDAATIAGLSMEEANAHIRSGEPLGTVLGKIRTAWAGKEAEQPQSRGANGSITAGTDAREKMISGMTDALAARAIRGVKMTEQGREFANMGMLDMAREFLTEVGEYKRGMSARQIAEGALFYRSGNGMMSTADFPLVLGNTVNRTLREVYAAQERTYLPLVHQTTAKDFRPKTSIQISEIKSFPEVKEGGEYTRTAFGEAAESYKVAKYGQIVPITWEALVNDDLGVFQRILPGLARAGARTQSNIVWSMILGNPVMADGEMVFSTAHKNVIASGTDLGIDSMGIMRALMRRQTDIGGLDPLNITPKYLVVGPSMEQKALQFTSVNYVPNTPGNQNVWAGLVTPIVEPRITDNRWYFVADPASFDGIETAFLEGESEIFTEQRVGFDVDGFETKVRMVFGAKVVDFRGMAMNPGI